MLGVCDTSGRDRHILEEITEAIQKCAHDVHAVLFVIEYVRMTSEFREVISELLSVFDNEVKKSLILVFSKVPANLSVDRTLLKQKLTKDPPMSEGMSLTNPLKNLMLAVGEKWVIFPIHSSPDHIWLREAENLERHLSSRSYVDFIETKIYMDRRHHANCGPSIIFQDQLRKVEEKLRLTEEKLRLAEEEKQRLVEKEIQRVAEVDNRRLAEEGKQQTKNSKNERRKRKQERKKAKRDAAELMKAHEEEIKKKYEEAAKAQSERDELQKKIDEMEKEKKEKEKEKEMEKKKEKEMEMEKEKEKEKEKGKEKSCIIL
ncbi:hypothetical protein BC936DRAFT_141290 [Jimgerdemannia flammicorona]|uniref:AIG1-type G domain-containing protein n=1 Tax=Jimgerdemannia flammicorona TaxID=994334 RepID=A0A433A2I3_9FUNG|nr:hypothetical protein BC936DRAFT_141290 [Jimgerdemannia flammicorona]